jgi:putative ABC transport system permease protein
VGGRRMSDQRGWRRYARIFRGDARAETEDELSFHLEMRVRDHMRRGLSEAEARAAAAARLGDLERVRRECGDIDAEALRERRRREWFAELRQDLRFGARMLARAPSFTVMAVLTLAMGIGATTAIFSLAHAVLLAPLPYPDADRVVRVWETSPQGNMRNVVSPGNFTDWAARATSFAELGAYRNPYGLVLSGEGEATRVLLSELQPAVLRALAVPPLHGRLLTDEDAAGAGDVVLLSHAFWQQRFGSDPGVSGRRIVLNDVPHTVAGVMPPGFAFPNAEVELWRPITVASINVQERRSHNLYVIGRLAHGVTLSTAQAEMTGIGRALTSEYPEFMTGYGVNVVRLHGDLTAHVRPLFIVMLGAVGAVLLIACGNLTNLLLARGVARQREVAVRAALGAGRGRIARQLLTEGMLLAGLGGAAALLLAPWLLKTLVAAAPAEIPLLERAAIDMRMLLFTGGLAVGCALLFGLAPTVRLLRLDAQAALRGGRDGSGAGQARMRGALLVAQVALSVVLLIGAGLFVRSFTALQATELGFDPDDIVTMGVDLPASRYGSTEEHAAFFDALLERVRAIPVVVATTGTNEPPGAGYEMTFSFSIEGRPSPNESGREDPEQLSAVTPDYFDALRQQLVTGRTFTALDRGGAPAVAIVSESLARKHWPGGDVIGRRIAFREGESPWLRIVGVVEDVRLASPDREPVPMLYIPYAQKTWTWMSWMTIVARVRPGTNSPAAQAALRAALLQLDPLLPPQSLSTVADAFRENTARRSFSMVLVAGFGVVALALTIVGLYGLLAYNVAREQREIGVRMALGATNAAIISRVLGRSLLLALVGVGSGIVIALAASHVLEALLYAVSPVDVPTYAFAAMLVLTAAVLTAVIPARRAASITPLHALR